MKRSFKLGLCAVGCVAVGSLVTGVAVAVTTTTTNPVKLCVNKDRMVSTPDGNGACRRSETAISVASPADVAALAARLDADETAITTLTNRLDAAQQKLDTLFDRAVGAFTITASVRPLTTDQYNVTATGVHLVPGTQVHRREMFAGIASDHVEGTVAADGTFREDTSLTCLSTEVIYVGTDIFGTVTSDILAKGPGCA